MPPHHHHHHHHGRGGSRGNFGGWGDNDTTIFLHDDAPELVLVDVDGNGTPDMLVHPADVDAQGILPTIVTGSDARNYIDETDTGYNTLDASIQASGVAADFKTSWAATYAGWKTFSMAARASVGLLDAKAVMDQTDRWVTTLGNFSTQFHALSPGSTVPTMPVPAGQGVPDTSTAALLSGSTGLVVAGAVLAGILVFGRYLK
jgi:hypothetical protein